MRPPDGARELHVLGELRRAGAHGWEDRSRCVSRHSEEPQQCARCAVSGGYHGRETRPDGVPRVWQVLALGSHSRIDADRRRPGPRTAHQRLYRGTPGAYRRVADRAEHPRRHGCRSEEHTSELQSPCNLVCRLLLEKKKKINNHLFLFKKKKKNNTNY